MKNQNNQNKIHQKKYEQIIHNYQTNISKTLTINNDLNTEVEDLLNSIIVNKDIIFDQFKDKPEYQTIENNLIELIENFFCCYDEKITLESQLRKLDNFKENLPKEVELLQINNNNLKNELSDLLKKIYKSQVELEKLIKNAVLKIPRDEKIIISPTKQNLDLYDSMLKLSSKIENNNFNSKDKKEIELTNAKIKIIEEQLNKLLPKINKKIENIENVDENNIESDEKSDENEENLENEVWKKQNLENKKDENLEILEQIQFFKKEVEKLEIENKESRKKIREYDIEYKKYKEQIKNFRKPKKSSSKNNTNLFHNQSYRAEEIYKYK